ncbi:type II secretion system protein E [Gemmatirosa kalamazoonensis]|uniref:Type II secretion system protein E n=1 Tax=Gemmatirosa kalamazoonensis TaxID=861299 RepID=W0RKV7_9BACT|nr:GspE/PulE family protein [Gemmatirosa kalamazoonensis]AHG91401.1 type II secretion system protein E [Gemmatirosa kalamazoonensis]
MQSPAATTPEQRLESALRAVLPAAVDLGAAEASCGERWAAARRAASCDDAALAERLARHFGVGVAVIAPPDPALRRLVPLPLAQRLGVLPLRASAVVLTVAAPAPGDPAAEGALAAASGRRVRFAIAPPDVVATGLATLYGGEEQGADARPVVRLVDRVVADGVTRGASDIHLECGEAGVVVRYRVDGVLLDATTLARDAGIPVVSRIKIMSGLDIADRLRPQDGRARVTVGGRTLDLRVSTLPAAHGEKVVIRVLDGAATTLSLDGLGLADADLARFTGMLDAREGLVLVTGPTGSGKTTTLYAALRHVQQRGVNVVTVEDPVEYRLAGVTQVAVNERAGLTFAAALRSILRQDPDVVLVGEIRDRETATIAVQASLTGHLVLSTLHTIDAAAAVARLTDLGVEPFKLAAALRGVVAQRLLRRICARCRGGAADCPSCSGSGYRGRAAAVELLVAGEEVSRRIARGEPAAAIADAARDAGMRTLWDSGIDQVRRGVTDDAELRRALEPPAERSSAVRPAALGLPDLDALFDLLSPSERRR